MLVSLDIETARADHITDPTDKDALIPHRSKITCVGLWLETGIGEVYRDLNKLSARLEELEALYGVSFVGHEFRFDIKQLHFNSPLDGHWLIDRWVDDTKLMAYVYPEKIPEKWLQDYEIKRVEANKQLPRGASHRRAGLHSLKTLAPYFLDVSPFWETPDNHDNDEYVLKDVQYTFQLKEYFDEVMLQDDYKFYKEKQLEWGKELLRAELKGIALDDTLMKIKEAESISMQDRALRQIKTQWEHHFKIYEAKARNEIRTKYDDMCTLALLKLKDTSKIEQTMKRYEDLCAKAITKAEGAGDLLLNLNSPDQLKWLLKEQLGYDLTNFHGEESTEKEVLENLATKNKDVQALLDYRKYAKLCSTYYPSYKSLQVKGRIHCGFNTSDTRTGRLSCIEGRQFVSTTNGDVMIKDIKPGDMVYTFNRKNRPSVRKVLAQEFMGIKKVLKVKYANKDKSFEDSLVCTYDHHIKINKYDDRATWVQAKDLDIGDRLYGFVRADLEYVTGKFDEIRVTAVDPIEGEAGVYDLTIDDHENFVVNNICVHNSSFPNLQQVPPDIKGIFTADKGYQLLSFDLSQIEPRLVAYFSEDKTLCKSFIEGNDFHAVTAKALFPYIDCSIKEVKRKYSAERNVAKTAGLAVLYGSGGRRMKRILDEAGFTGYTESRCRDLVKRIRKTYHGAWDFKKKLDWSAENGDVIYNLLGRPFKFTDPREVYMKAYNKLIQGSASDLLLQAIKETNEYARYNNIDAQVVAAVHDEICLHCPESRAVEMKKVLTDNMTRFKLDTPYGNIPLLVEGNVGTHWSK